MSEYIITKEQIEELNRAHGGMKIVTSWLSCYAIWDTSNTYPVMKSEHVAVDLPEIVRCRDCIYYKPYRTHSHGIMNRCYDENGHTHRRDESDFCSRGERRYA